MKLMKCCALVLMVAGSALVSGCVCYTEGNTPIFYRPFITPVYVEPAPLPPPVVFYYTPDYYVWDGFEYVGVCGGNYVYWQVNTWVVCESFRVERFHHWEGDGHRDWREHAFRPDRRDPRPGREFSQEHRPDHPGARSVQPDRVQQASQQQRVAPSYGRDRSHDKW